jgi:hypothetical protein
MNCTKAEQLIPLDAGGDLQPPEADSLRQHIEACAHCQQIAEEFAASQTWLSEFAAPSFDEAVFADLRASVRREIEQTESAGERGRWFEWLLPSWNPRWAMAAMAAAIILFGVWAGRVIRSAQQAPEEMAVVGVVRPLEGPKPPIPPPPQPPVRIATFGSFNSTKHRQQAPQASLVDQAVNAVEAPSTDLTAENPTDQVRAVEPTDGTVLAKAEPVVERGMLRIEMQTADPNIRIIWFAPKPDNSPIDKTK